MVKALPEEVNFEWAGVVSLRDAPPPADVEVVLLALAPLVFIVSSCLLTAVLFREEKLSP